MGVVIYLDLYLLILKAPLSQSDSIPGILMIKYILFSVEYLIDNNVDLC
jgi:hypothetical protein